jgi:Xaa-Pro aminopeptidase
VSDRAQRLAAELAGAGVDVLLVSALSNVRYLTGYTGSNGLALVGCDTRAFLTDFRYVEQAAAEVERSFDRRRAEQDLLSGIQDVLPPGEVRLGFDSARMPVATHAKLRELLEPRIELVPAPGLVERLRVVKEPEEVERIRAAAKLADESLSAVLEGGVLGRGERELALALEWEMRTRGAQRVSFDPILAAGAHGALPHAQPREHRIASGEMVVIDWGAELDGYCSDCTRTVAAGRAGEPARAVYELVLRAQLAGLDAIAAGAAGKLVDAAARAVIDGAGHAEHFGHGLGHGVGIEVHEAPRLSKTSEDTLRAGNIVTVEPGVYLPGVLGVRIEDLVVVTESGREILTSLDKALLELS